MAEKLSALVGLDEFVAADDDGLVGRVAVSASYGEAGEAALGDERILCNALLAEIIID